MGVREDKHILMYVIPTIINAVQIITVLRHHQVAILAATLQDNAHRHHVLHGCHPNIQKRYKNETKFSD